MKEIREHEIACERSKCSNELCGIPLEDIPDTVKFQFGNEEKVACSKKCKKVTKFALMLKRKSEAEVLRAFEGMLRKKSGKKHSVANYKPSGGGATGLMNTMKYGPPGT
jgi:hypothetical protein